MSIFFLKKRKKYFIWWRQVCPHSSGRAWKSKISILDKKNRKWKVALS